MWPNIDCLVMHFEQTLADAASRIVIHSIAAFNVLIVNLVCICLILRANVCSKALRQLWIFLTDAIRDFTCVPFDRLCFFGECIREIWATSLGLCTRLNDTVPIDRDVIDASTCFTHAPTVVKILCSWNVVVIRVHWPDASDVIISAVARRSFIH